MGRSASPFKGFVHKCDRTQFLQCLWWQVVQSAGDGSNSAFIQTAHHLCSPLPIHKQSHTTTKKLENSQRLLRCCAASFFLPKLYAKGWRVGEVIVENTTLNYSHRMTSNSESLLHPPFHHFSPYDPPLIHVSLCVFMLDPLRFTIASSKLIQIKWSVLKKRNCLIPLFIWFMIISVSLVIVECFEWLSWSIWYLFVHIIESIGGPWENTEGGKS